MSTILFVDDHHAYRTVFAEVLRNAGHNVLEAARIAEAEHLLDRHRGPTDVLVVEAVLNTMNGTAVAKRVRARCPDIQVLFISEQPAQELRNEGRLPEGEHFLSKRLPADALIVELRELTRNKVGAAHQAGNR